MKIVYLKKQKGRIYESEAMLPGLRHDESGAPMMDGCFVSVSDTPLHWAACISEVRVGFDMEESSRVVSPGSVKALHPLEQRYLSAVEAVSSEWREEFLAIWTAKESYMKFCGVGLRLGTTTFSVIGEDLGFLGRVQKKGYPGARLLRLEAPRGLMASLCLSAETEEGQGPGEGSLPSVTKSEAVTVPAGGASYSSSSPRWELFEYDAPFRLSALEKAAGYLDGRSYASGELREKLKKDGYADEDIKEAVSALEERGYLSDLEYARSYAEKSRERGKGRLRIKRELSQKGVSHELIERVLDSGADAYDSPGRAGESGGADGELDSAGYETGYESPESESEFGRALAAALKAAPGIAAETDRIRRDKLLAKVGRKLSSLGYETSVIYAVLGRLRGMSGEDE